MLVAAGLGPDDAVQEDGRDGLALCPTIDDLTSTFGSDYCRTFTT